MTTENLDDRMPCVRGCTWEPSIEGEAPRPRTATHGLLCASCFYRLSHALDMIPDLMANMRLQVVPLKSGWPDNDRVSGGGGGSPAPLRIDPLDASDSLFAKLVTWTEVFGGEFHHPQPSVAVWINLREVQGSRPVTPDTAHDLASQLTAWFHVRLEQIAASPTGAAFHDDLCFGWEEARGVFALAASYGPDPKPIREADKRECPVCGRREVFVKWPNLFDSDIAVMCGRCKWVAEPEKYGHYAELFKRA